VGDKGQGLDDFGESACWADHQNPLWE
jgi:hypothetical protein